MIFLCFFVLVSLCFLTFAPPPIQALRRKRYQKNVLSEPSSSSTVTICLRCRGGWTAATSLAAACTCLSSVLNRRLNGAKWCDVCLRSAGAVDALSSKRCGARAAVYRKQYICFVVVPPPQLPPPSYTHTEKKMLCTRFSLIHKGRFLDCLRHLLWLHNSQETNNTKQKYWLNSDL